MKIYVASSWRNLEQPSLVRTLRAAGYRVYDFKNPKPECEGFHWSSVRVTGDQPEGPSGEVTPWKQWSPAQFVEAMNSDLAKDGFALDMNALQDCDAQKNNA